MGYPPTLLFLLIYPSMQHEPAQLLPEFSNLSLFSASQTPGQDFVTSLIPPLPQPTNEATSELLPCSREDPGMKTQPPPTPDSSQSEVPGQQLAQEKAHGVPGGKNIARSCAQRKPHRGGLILGLMLQVPALCCVNPPAWGHVGPGTTLTSRGGALSLTCNLLLEWRNKGS